MIVLFLCGCRCWGLTEIPSVSTAGLCFPHRDEQSWHCFSRDSKHIGLECVCLLCTTPRHLWKCCPWGIKDFLHSPPISSLSSLPLNHGDKMFPQLFCSLLLHSQGSLTQRCSHCPCTNPAPTCFGLPEDARSSDQQHGFGWGLKWSSENESSKPSSFSASRKEQRKPGKAIQTQPSPKGLALQCKTAALKCHARCSQISSLHADWKVPCEVRAKPRPPCV